MNSDSWLPTAPVRTTLTKQPVNTESGLRMHASQKYIKAAQKKDLARTILDNPRSAQRLSLDNKNDLNKTGARYGRVR